MSFFKKKIHSSYASEEPVNQVIILVEDSGFLFVFKQKLPLRT